MKRKNNVPWYKNWEFWAETADKYIASSKNIPMKSLYDSEIETFVKFYIAKVIFESNLIEGAGLSLGKTQQLINKYLPEHEQEEEF